MFLQRKKKRTKTRAPRARHGRPPTSAASRRPPAVADPPGPSAGPAPAGGAVRRGRRGPAARLPGLRAGRAHSPRLLPDAGRCVCPAAPRAPASGHPGLRRADGSALGHSPGGQTEAQDERVIRPRLIPRRQRRDPNLSPPRPFRPRKDITSTVSRVLTTCQALCPPRHGLAHTIFTGTLFVPLFR